MTQSPLFLESIYDALRAAVDAAGGPKAVGQMLFPSTSVEAARTKLLDCLNPTRAERLDPEQTLHLFRIARDVGFHAAKHWLDAELGYAPTPPIEPEDQAAELARVIANASDQLRRATDALERMRTPGGRRK